MHVLHGFSFTFAVVSLTKPEVFMQIRFSILGEDGDWMVTDVIDDVGGDWWIERYGDLS